MSYVRRGDDSDVYVFDGGDLRGLECNYCELSPWKCGDDEGERHFFAPCDEMLAHLREHYRAGHAVPQRAFDAIRELSTLGCCHRSTRFVEVPIE